MGALWIAHVDVTDAEKYAEYVEIASIVIPEHGGTFIARGGKFVQFEGRERARNVVARFPSVEAAEAAYNDPRYQDAVKIAKMASERELMVIETTD
ncbi:DUF1330 domain-containing protein [Boseongicola aestuarii]|jgi:uncharacterized protein (DUF1330 family)|uniref:DUF1330 domain-containing protein n=1 Tax=Boseongicola aestuarii TaxID=1470561 RepID=A0A238IVV0_9RHOB|nr:DUF1330 domain-containing protein [Boseongicola aestuarii]SMX22151.1 hypothetical protein BOA8489_00241 [Boseongicola aestuarii]